MSRILGAEKGDNYLDKHRPLTRKSRRFHVIYLTYAALN